MPFSVHCPEAIIKKLESKMPRFVVPWSQIYTAPVGFSIKNPEFQFFGAYPALLLYKAIVRGFSP
jgi:hypothetical protein